MKKISLKLISIIVAIITLISVAGVGVYAATAKTMTNVIVVVRYNTDTENVYNSVASSFTTRTNWQDLKSYYNDTTDKYPEIDNDISFKNYISLISRGAVTINNYFPQDAGTTANVFTLAHDHDYYTDDYTLVKEIMDAFNNGTLAMPSSKLDNVQSGIMDCLTVITQGDSDSYATDSVLYPHKGILGSSETVGGKYIIANYIMMDSNSVFNSQRTGVITHEYMHVMGFPDLYRNSGNGTPVGSWDIMAGVSNYKQYPLSYMRSLYGWVPLNNASVTGTYTLDATTLNTDNAVLKLQTPMSDTEFFCLEYRKKKTEGVVAGLGIETKIPNSGLLIYRVNNSVENHSNFVGNDYLYVFRPGDTSTSASAGEIYNAAVTPSLGETSYGSANFNAKLTDNTIFYSNGKNSGIVISNITVSNDENSITFDVTYPDYTSLNLWDKTGDSFSSGVYGDINMDMDDNGNIYTVVSESTDWSSKVQAYKYNGTAWAKMGGSYANGYDQKIAVCDNVPYMTFIDSNGYPVVYKWSGSAWTLIKKITTASYPMSLDLFAEGSHLYLGYANGSNNIVISEVTASGVTQLDASKSTTNSYANVGFAAYNGKIYTEYSVFSWGSGADKNTYICEFDLTTKKWTTVQTLAANGANIHCLSVNDGILYALTGQSGSYPIYASFDGVEWSQETAQIGSMSYSGLRLGSAGDVPYVVYSSGGILKIEEKTEDGWASVGEITSDCTYFDFMFKDGKAFAATISDGNTNATVFNKQLYYPPVVITGTATKVAVGNTIKLSATGGSGSYTWNSGNNTYATVSQDGTVKGLKQGSAIITATDSMGAYATYFVKVTPNDGRIVVYITRGSQNQKVSWLKKYSSAKMSVAYEEYNCQNAVSFKWSSSNSLVKIDQKGNVTCNSIFSCSSVLTMTAYDADGVKISSGSIKVCFYKFDFQNKGYNI